jgi:23S rRNA pseudouridine1911/1915/1917 synthase
MELRLVAQREGRLSGFLRGELKMSLGLMNRLKWGDAIRVNGMPQHTDFAVKPDDVITVRLDEAAPEYPAEQGELTILFEDDHILVVDKPSGMLIHPSRAKNTDTLANRIVDYYQRSGQQAAFHPVTRLDRDTFGIVLVAKNSHIHSLLQGADIRKTYHALVFGRPEQSDGIIDAPIARRPLPSLLRYIGPEGKPSVTEYRVLERFCKCAKLELRPITGRTHQLRLHCAYMGWPIVGDPQYGTADSGIFSEKKGIKSQLLCAKRLEFIHPITEQPIDIESQMDVNELRE